MSFSGYDFVSVLIHVIILLSSLAHGQNTESPCVNAGDCYPEASTANFFGTSLFGWDKCTNVGVGPLNQKSWINGGYDDVHTMADVDGTYANIPWNSAAANDFFGPDNKLGSDIKTQITNIFSQVRQTYSGHAPFAHWIHAKCGDETSACYIKDPCKPDEPPVISDLQAYADLDDGKGYSMITFCPQYFALPALSTAMTIGLGQEDPIDRFDLENYENRGKIFFFTLYIGHSA